MKIFWPLILYEPSACGKAVVLRSVSDEPACGSVRAIVPCQVPANIFATIFNFKARDFFEIEDPVEKKAPKVSFT